MSKTAWGEAAIIEQIVIDQGEFQTFVQLLEAEGGETFVRFAYATGGTARRGPVTLRGKDLARLRKLLVKHDRLRDALDVCRPAAAR